MKKFEICYKKYPNGKPEDNLEIENNKIKNPHTGKWVKRDGKAGKELLFKYKAMKVTKKVTEEEKLELEKDIGRIEIICISNLL